MTVDHQTRNAIDEEKRTVSVAFSSESPVERWFGREILDHEPKSIRLGRLTDGAAVLVDHNPSDQVGVIEEVKIDSDKMGRATLRFGKSARAEEIFQDVKDGIRTKISFGYRVHDMRLEEVEDGEEETYRVTDWEPFEISLVSIPADTKVGVNRSENVTKKNEVKAMPTETKTESQAPAVHIDTEAQERALKKARADEMARIKDIQAIGSKFDLQSDAERHIEEGASVADFQQFALLRINERMTGRKEGQTVQEIGLDAREAGNYSFTRALCAIAFPNDREAQEAAGFEREVSQEACKRSGFKTQGFLVPPEVLKRDLSVGTATAGGNLVATDLLSGSFIDLLRNALVIAQLGARTLTDLQGDVAIPRQTGAATAAWIATEGGNASESQLAVDQVTLTPRTLGVYTDYTRNLLLQSSIDVESLVRMDLVAVMARAIDLAALYGSGASGQPTGISNQTGVNTTTFGAADPTYAEIVAMESAIATDNALTGNLAYVMDGAMRGALKTTEKASSTGQFVWETGNTVNGYLTAVSEQVTDGDIFFGNFADLLMGMWGGLDLTIDPYTQAISGTRRIVALQSVDVAVRHPVSFCFSNDGV